MSANYLNNKDMLLEIHKSKISFCQYEDEKHTTYDIIVRDYDDIFKQETIDEAKKNKAARIASKNYQAAIKAYDGPISKKPKQADFKLDPDTLETTELVFRVLSYDHIPLEPGRKKNPKNEAEKRIKLNFIPFKHYILNNDLSSTKTVLISHFKDGEFCQTHGAMTDKLATMFMLLVNRYSQRSNWRGYTYVDEMKGQALLQLSQMGLQFDESKSSNPFAYFTAAISNSFTKVLNIEKKNQNIRDDLLVKQGQNPSFTRQLEYEEQINKMRESWDEK